jgi:FAD/FMN-containing dehydrogenase
MGLLRTPDAGVIAALKEAAGPGGWTEDGDVIAPHLIEWRDRWSGTTPLMLMPSETATAQRIVGLCHQARIAITTQGGNTGLVGAQIPQGEVLLSTRRMQAIRRIDPVDDALVAEAGVVLSRVHDAAREAGRRFPLSLASEGTATVGGLISTNAGGVHVRRHGMMRAQVLGLEAVLPDGSLLEGLSSLRKDNTGYDLKQLLIGAEGTLGLVTAATLRLVAVPGSVHVAMLALDDARQAVDLLHLLEARTGAVAAFEIMNRTGVELALRNVPSTRDPFAAPAPWLALVEFEGSDDTLAGRCEAALGEALEAGLARDGLLAQNGAQAKAFWFLREEMSAGQKPEGVAAKHDVSVPVSAIPAFLEQAEAVVRKLVPRARIVAFGHASDGNIHYDVVQPSGADPAAFKAGLPALVEAVHDVVSGFSGSISAEHGIGISRRDEFIRREPPAQLAAMRAIKAALDPHAIFNPRVLL